MVAPPDPALTDGNVVLREFRLTDAPAIVTACEDPDIPRFTMMPEGLTLDGAVAWIERAADGWDTHDTARFAITLADDDTMVGQVGAAFERWARRAEAFYWVTPAARGRGAASGALGLVTEWAFAVEGVVRVHLTTMVENVVSQRVAARAGFEREGILRSWMPVKDAQPDLVMWSRVRT